MTTAAAAPGRPGRELRAYLSVLAVLALGVLGWLLAASAVPASSSALVPVAALVAVAHVCPVWARPRRLRSQWLDASDVGLVVAVVLLPLPVALLVHVLVGLVAVLVEFRRSAVHVLYNAAHVVLTAAATGALLWWWAPSERWTPWAAGAACFLVEQLLAQPMLLTVASLREGHRVSPRRLLLDRPVATVAVPLATALLAALAGVAASVAGAVVAWLAALLLCALAVVSRSRLEVLHETVRLLHAERVLTASASGGGTSPVLATLDEALVDVGGVAGVRVIRADDVLPPGHLAQSLPSGDGTGLRLLVRRPAETTAVYGSREEAVRALLRTGAQAYAIAEAALVLRHDAHHDSLTGLHNRAGFVARADAELARAQRSHLSAVVVYVDLDGFKAVNDRLGHEAGDRALQRVAAELREVVRPHDVVARLGGDEFALLLLDLPTCEQGSGVVDRVCERLAAGWPVAPGSRLRLSGSVGTACFPEDADDLPGLLRHADARMYEQKRARRG